MDKYLLPLINKYQNYSHSSTFTIELHKLSDINTWFPLFELDNPQWWIINEFFDHCDTYETYTTGMNTTEVLKRITTITNIFSNCISIESSDEFIVINDYHIYPIIIYCNETYYYTCFIFHNKTTSTIFNSF